MGHARAAGGLDARALAAYGFLALPLATAALPMYVHLPSLYGGSLGMDLAVLGAVLLCARLADAFVDPLLGALNDRLRRPGLLAALGIALLTAGLLMALNPPRDGTALWPWLSAALVPVYLGYSLASVSYLAWGSLLGETAHERTKVTAVREAFGLAGVVSASVLPLMLATEMADGLARFSFALVPVALFGVVLLVTLAPRPAIAPRAPRFDLAAMLAPLAGHRFKTLLAVFVMNGIASALPATLVLFFVDDVLRARESAGLFLALYFVAGAASLPCWVALSRRAGKPTAWLAAMLLAIVAFCGAFALGEGDLAAFGVICVLSGLALGADLALPPAMLADTIRDAGHEARAGSYFGLWTFATKLSLALAAGLALPLLAHFGYEPGNPGTVRPLAYAYCLLPCLLKLAAAGALWTGIG
ncbi:unnamed protein product, partial [Phaeothamnion confervicola]